tara:strand:+ start:314 stop:532 length:219 start_codon:yes stop_codon:yes gene_type:complete
MSLSETDKLCKAIHILKPDTQFTVRGNVINEETFNNIEWNTGVDGIGGAVSTTTNPHSELSWSAVKTEIDKL